MPKKKHTLSEEERRERIRETARALKTLTIRKNSSARSKRLCR
jgi:hypothetical protein